MHSRLALPWRILHFAVLFLLGTAFLYAGWQVMFALAPEGASGPLWGRSAEIPHELLVARRLYAIECWVAFGALAIYLAITEIRPRMGS